MRLSETRPPGLLSKLTERQGELLRCFDGRRFLEWTIDPGPQIPMREEVHSQQRDQVRQGPSELRLQLEVLQDQHRDQRCPNLSLQRVGGSPDESLDLEILLERLEEQLDLPAVLVDLRDRRRRE